MIKDIMIKLTLALLLLCGVAVAQTGNTFIVGGQLGANVLQTKSYASSLMLGFQTQENDKFLIGVVSKSISTPTSHDRNYLGIRAHAQTTLPLKITPFLSYDFVKGEYYIYNGIMDKEPKVKKDWQGQGTLGIGYPINSSIDLFIGYIFMDYNPSKYESYKTSPYRDGNISVKINFTLPIN